MRAISLVSMTCIAALAFAGCGDDNGNSTPDGPTTQCSDGKDNDNDGKIDFPDDPGCTSASGDDESLSPPPQCMDGRDNDGDGKIDFPADPGCSIAQQDMEDDDCPDGPHCPQCANGRDDDMNGMTDYPNDLGCLSASDPTEFVNNPLACGPTLKIDQLPGDGVLSNVALDGMSTTSLLNNCTANAGAPALGYIFQLTAPKVVVASTDDATTDIDTVLSIRPMMCTDAAVACNNDSDDPNAVTERGSKLTASLDPGTYFLIVQGYDSAELGNFTMHVDRFAGEGAACAMPQDCGPGLVCRVPHGQSAMSCSQPVCNDGLDDDGDGKMDYPADPGCNTPDDDTENDNCPGGAGCPECADMMDNDMDGMTDYPADTTCHAASNSSESCIASEGVASLVMPVTTVMLSTATNDNVPSCQAANAGKDLTFRLDVPALTSLTLNTTGADTVNSLYDSSCGGTPLKCSDPPSFTLAPVAAGTYYYFVDAYSSTTPTTSSVINVSGVIANGASCESALAQSGALTCGSGYTCKGAMGSRTCSLAQCNDGMDNNANSKMDYPADPGCDSPSDDTETTVCPGAMCPVCSDMIDNDMDGQTDYPADTSCIAASGGNESCVSTEPVTEITTAMTMGNTTMAANDVMPTCGLTTSTAKDLTYKVVLPVTSTVTFNVTGIDSVTSLLNATCASTGTNVIKCSDPQSFTLTNQAAGTYYFVVDGYSSTTAGAFTINVTGKIPNGGSCEVPLATSATPGLTCNDGYTCKGTTGSRTCQPVACSDGIDNNADGKIDYPNDPGCSAPNDDTETTVCPGAMCPVCSNMMDDDTDTLLDYPADYGCASAGGSSEVFCTADPDFGAAITMPTTAGDLSTAADNVNFTQCATLADGNDRTFALQLPVPVATLQLDTNNSTAEDLVIWLKDSACGNQFGCDDEGGDGSEALLSLTNVAAGNYAVIVKAYFTSSNEAFVLNVHGTVAAGNRCDSPLFTSGVLSCVAGLSCNATSHKCQ